MWRVDEHAIDIEDRASEAHPRRPRPERAVWRTRRRRLGDRERGAVAAAQLADVVADAHADSSAVAGEGGDGELGSVERDGDRRATELHRHPQPVQPIGDLRIEIEHVVADLGAEVGALDEVQGAGHHPQVDPLLGGAALDVGDVALQRDEESLP